MTPRLEAVWFTGPSNQYGRLARVLDYTARKHNPSWSIRVREIPPGNLVGESDSYTSNSWKLEEWTRIICEAEDGERVLLIDADTFVLAPLDGIFDGDFDVKLTRRDPTSPYPINAGVVAVTVGARARDFFRAWLAEDRRLLRDPVEHRKWGKLFAGMNQSSLGSIRTRGVFDARVVEVPCVIWNLEDSTWKHFGPETRIVHVKSGLRSTVFAVGPTQRQVLDLANLWRKVEREALAFSSPK